ncbi:MAG: hypothetical protein ACI978_002754, partial [Oleispira sp.]
EEIAAEVMVAANSNLEQKALNKNLVVQPLWGLDAFSAPQQKR